MSADGLPDVIDSSQRAYDRRDTETAVVADDGHTYAGIDAIRGWLDHGASEHTYTRTLTGFDDLGDGACVVHNHRSGNFPGGEVDLHHRFAIGDDLIRHLDIAP